MRFRVTVWSVKGESNPWFIEAEDQVEAARKLCPSNNKYWEFEARRVNPHPNDFQVYRRLINDPFRSTFYRKRNSVPLGVWLPYGGIFRVRFIAYE